MEKHKLSILMFVALSGFVCSKEQGMELWKGGNEKFDALFNDHDVQDPSDNVDEV